MRRAGTPSFFIQKNPGIFGMGRVNTELHIPKNKGVKK
jgi:hypothetical protein